MEDAQLIRREVEIAKQRDKRSFWMIGFWGIRFLLWVFYISILGIIFYGYTTSIGGAIAWGSFILTSNFLFAHKSSKVG